MVLQGDIELCPRCVPVRCQVNVPYSAYHPRHVASRSPSLQATPVSAEDLKKLPALQKTLLTSGGASTSNNASGHAGGGVSRSSSANGGSGPEAGPSANSSRSKTRQVDAGPVSAGNVQPKTTIVDADGCLRCPDCHCPLRDTTSNCTWYFQCPQCQVRSHAGVHLPSHWRMHAIEVFG